MRHVWRQPLPYYAYDGISQLLDSIKGLTSRRQRREMDLISEQEARLLFRVTNFFNPPCILQAGASTGVESVAMLEVNHGSRLFLYDPELEHNPLAVRVLHSQLGRVECYDDMTVAAGDFLEAVSGQPSMVVLVNKAVDASLLERLLDEGAVTVMRNLGRDSDMASLFKACCAHMTKGQTFTNGKIAVLIPDKKLQREDFVLWLS